ncbi:RNA polymerase sigma factor [Actinoplanes sp. N902-109]|uniref:RNA polymerase sigma factor n=1 Tax=Actinoplanes sp. (strain N902-109) TaxID=649831 RepID=UPI0003295B78|nr:sigma-70 family RNA polymerase sigma factor [Actinoplanes sp. N902-109]AGL18416.1 ECF subfamily RNA polymerase sigma-24 subunit [Actinoplanes sp. N902-109]
MEEDLRQTILDAQTGDERAFERLIRTFESLVWWTVRTFRLAEADAEDAVQNTWLRMYEHLHEIRDPDRTGAWLTTVARRECLQLLRTGRREVVGLPPDTDRPDERGPQPERVAVQRSMNDLLWRHVNELPAPARTLLTTLSAGNSPGYAAFARSTDMPIGSVGPTRQRSLRKLRIRLECHGLGAYAWH